MMTRESVEKLKYIDRYEALANAIVLQAVKDYRKARKKLTKNPDNVMAKATVHEIECFFRSKWYGILTKVDGEMLIQRLREEVSA